MIYIITALSSEAKPLIHHYRLKRNTDVDFLLYESDTVFLCITQVGYNNALHVSGKFLEYKKPAEDDILVNIGLCGAPESYNIGELLVIEKLCFKDREALLTCRESLHVKASLTTLIQEQYENLNKVVDMEAFGIYERAKEFFKINQLLFVKIVSDHFEPKSLTKNLAYGLINRNIKEITSLIKRSTLCQQR